MEITTITRDELVKMMQSGAAFKLVDVLVREHYDKEHIKGAISLPLKELREQAPAVLPNKDETLVVYCGSFSCPASTSAAKILMSIGYTKVFDYKGGLKDYKENNLPLTGSLHTHLAGGKQILLHGKPVTLVGKKLKLRERAPNFRVVDKDLQDVNLSDYTGQIKVISSFISLDTPVCDMQVKEFNKMTATLSDKVVILGISKDLPFAQSRFCSANNINNEQILSDYKYSSFGINFGLLIKENNLLARAVIILDGNDFIRYAQVEEELTMPPNYSKALEHLQKVIASPALEATLATPDHCVPCEEGAAPLAKEKLEQALAQVRTWELVEGTKLRKEFKFKTFMEAKYFLDILANIAEEQGHHPTFTLIYNKLKVTLTTHIAGGLTDNDFFMVKIIDEVLSFL